MLGAQRDGNLKSEAAEWLAWQTRDMGRNAIVGSCFREIADQALTHAQRSNLSAEELVKELLRAGEVVESLNYAIDNGKAVDGSSWDERQRAFNSAGWFHQDVAGIFNQSSSLRRARVERTEVAAIAGRLLSLRWLTMPYLEWVIVDCLVCDEIIEFGEEVKRNWPGPMFIGANKVDFEGGGFDAIRRAEALRKVKTGAIWYVGVPATVAGAFLTGLHNVAFAIGGIWIVLVGLSMIGGAVRFALSLLGRKQPEQRHVSGLRLWGEMVDIYRTLGGAVLCPTMVRDALNRGREQGVVWDNAAYAVIEHVILRDSAAWSVLPPRL